MKHDNLKLCNNKTTCSAASQNTKRQIRFKSTQKYILLIPSSTTPQKPIYGKNLLGLLHERIFARSSTKSLTPTKSRVHYKSNSGLATENKQLSYTSPPQSRQRSTTQQYYDKTNSGFSDHGDGWTTNAKIGKAMPKMNFMHIRNIFPVSRNHTALPRPGTEIRHESFINSRTYKKHNADFTIIGKKIDKFNYWPSNYHKTTYYVNNFSRKNTSALQGLDNSTIGNAKKSSTEDEENRSCEGEDSILPSNPIKRIDVKVNRRLVSFNIYSQHK